MEAISKLRLNHGMASFECWKPPLGSTPSMDTPLANQRAARPRMAKPRLGLLYTSDNGSFI